MVILVIKKKKSMTYFVHLIKSALLGNRSSSFVKTTLAIGLIMLEFSIELIKRFSESITPFFCGSNLGRLIVDDVWVNWFGLFNGVFILYKGVLWYFAGTDRYNKNKLIYIIIIIYFLIHTGHSGNILLNSGLFFSFFALIANSKVCTVSWISDKFELTHAINVM